MSGLRLCFHVFTPYGDLYVRDSIDGDRALASLVTQYPGATVVIEDRKTRKALADELPLIRLLHVRRGLAPGVHVRSLIELARSCGHPANVVPESREHAELAV